MLTISVHGSRLKGDKVKLKVIIFLRLKMPGKLFAGDEEEAVEIVRASLLSLSIFQMGISGFPEPGRKFWEIILG